MNEQTIASMSIGELVSYIMSVDPKANPDYELLACTLASKVDAYSRNLKISFGKIETNLNNIHEIVENTILTAQETENPIR